MADKIPEVVESVTSNNGTRTVIHSILEPEATVFWHYHYSFDETFKVLEGLIDVWNDDQKITLKAGESATIKKGTLHKYLVGDIKTVIEVTFEPGSADFEKAMCILRGVQADGLYQNFSDPAEETLMFTAIITELTDSATTGETHDQLKKLYEEKGEQIAAEKKWLLEKYAEQRFNNLK